MEKELQIKQDLYLVWASKSVCHYQQIASPGPPDIAYQLDIK